MDPQNNILTIAYVNTCGQTKLNEWKQLQIEAFAKYKAIDILHLQETEICDETFENCNFLSCNYNIISNNSSNSYGTSSLIKSELNVENVRLDTEGRVIVFDVAGVTLSNVYLPSGTDARSRKSREQYSAETLPQLLLNRQEEGIIGGDWNAIINKKDATKHQEAKMSPSLLRLAKLQNWVDSFRSLHPTSNSFSRYYADSRGEGATRIDRAYHYGNLRISSAEYLPLAFSDHFGLVICVILPNPANAMNCS